MSFFILITIAISLSMDAFSLSLAYGTLDIEKKDIFLLSIIVGIYHFIMPNLGFILGKNILKYIPVTSDFIVFIILIVIGIEMIIDTIKKESNLTKMPLYQMLIFGFMVSIDSFSIGLGIESLCKNIIVSSIIFSITSLLFTMLGLFVGKKINQLFGKISTLIGGSILILIAFIYII